MVSQRTAQRLTVAVLALIAAFALFVFLKWHHQRASAQLERDWDSARQEDTIRAYQNYLERRPESSHEGEARQRVKALQDALEWEVAQRAGTASAYGAIAESDSAYAEEARRRMAENEAEAAWRRAAARGTQEAYRAFLEEWPASSRAATATQRIRALQEEEDWLAATRAGTRAAYQDFMGRYPGSARLPEARSKAVEREVAELLPRAVRKLAKPQAVLLFPPRDTTNVNVFNDLGSALTLLFSGPDSFKAEFAPREKGSLEFKKGRYQVVAKPQAPGAPILAEQLSFTGADYQWEIRLSGEAGRPVTSDEYRLWPQKRGVPRPKRR